MRIGFCWPGARKDAIGGFHFFLHRYGIWILLIIRVDRDRPSPIALQSVMEWKRPDFPHALISDEGNLLNSTDVFALMREAWWANDCSIDKVKRLLNNSFWLGLYLNGRLAGLARMVTDQETVCTITDVIIQEDQRRKGFGKWLMTCLIEHPRLKETSMTLGTQDADSFFEQFGFVRTGAIMHRPPAPPSTSPKPTKKPGFSLLKAGASVIH